MKKFLSVVLLLTVIAGSFTFYLGDRQSVAVAQDSIADLEQKQAELKKQNEEYKKKMEANKAKIDEQEAYKEDLVGRIDTVNEEIVVSQQKITELDSRIDGKTKKIKQLNKDIKDRTNTLRKRIKAIYMSGDVSSLEIILGAKDFDDFMDKLELVKNVSSFDEKLIKEIETDMEQVKADKKELETSKSKQVKEKENLQNKREDLQVLVDENEKVLDTLYTRNKKQEEAVKKNNGALNGIDDEIEAYYEEQARKQREAAAANNNSGNTGNDPIASPVVPTGNGYCWPVPGHTGLSSVFGEDRGSYGHGAIDISDGGIMGATVVAADGGTVVVSNNSCSHNWAKSGSCGCGGGYGNYVWIDHGNGKCTIYGHLTRSVVAQGSTVSKGQVIGYVGSTGWSSGPHLHFECRYNGVKYDPMSEF